MAVYPSKKAPIAAKLSQNTFRTVPDISFFDAENFFKTLKGRLPPEDDYDRPQTLGKRVSGDPRHLIFRRPHTFLATTFFGAKIVFETSNGRLPPEDGSDRPQTSGKRVSGDPRHFIFRRHKHFLRPKFLLQKFFSSTVRNIFQQSACFGVAVQVYTPLSNAAREFIARTNVFSLQRPLAEG